jgi:hypothetical protein
MLGIDMIFFIAGYNVDDDKTFTRQYGNQYSLVYMCPGSAAILGGTVPSRFGLCLKLLPSDLYINKYIQWLARSPFRGLCSVLCDSEGHSFSS